MENKNAKPLPKMLPGYICEQWKRCGKRRCRCAEGKLHGPYYYRFGWRQGRQFKEYVRLTDVAFVRQACQAHREMRAELRAGHKRFRDMVTLIRGYELQLRRLKQG